MAGVVGDINPKTIESAKRQFVELYGSALVMNTYLKLALLLVSLLALGLLVLNFRTPGRYRTEAAGGPDRRGRPRGGRAVRRAELSAAGAGAALLPDPVRGEALQPHPGDRPARISRFAVLPRPGLADATIAQNDQSREHRAFVTNPSADEVDIVVQNVSLSELAKPPLQGDRHLPEGLLHARNPGRTRTGNLRRAGRLRHARPRAERVRAREPVGPADHVLPRRSGVRGGAAMIANAHSSRP